jgi:hypothetical protein
MENFSVAVDNATRRLVEAVMSDEIASLEDPEAYTLVCEVVGEEFKRSAGSLDFYSFACGYAMAGAAALLAVHGPELEASEGS